MMHFHGLTFSREKALLSTDRICELLSNTYWASTRSREQIETSIRHSICFGVYQDDYQLGFARVVTDFATMFWLADVIIDEKFRGKGLGKKLVEYILDTEELRKLAGILGTKDAHELYKKYGYVLADGRFMVRMPQ